MNGVDVGARRTNILKRPTVNELQRAMRGDKVIQKLHARNHSWEPDNVRGYPLPLGGQFATSKSDLDPAIFDHHEAMHPWIRQSVIAMLGAFWEKRYPDWADWTRIYLAGSLASYWWGVPDWDTLIGIHTPVLVQRYPAFAGMSDAEVCAHLTAEFYAGLDHHTEHFSFPPAPDLTTIVRALGGPPVEAIYASVPEGVEAFGPMEMTWYANGDAWDIRSIKPYAAIELMANRWYVHPGRMGKNWGPKSLPWSFWEKMADVADSIKAALAVEDPVKRTEEAKVIYDKLHSDRGQAFGPSGTGVGDKRSLQWITINRWGLLGPLEQAIHPDRPMGHPAPLTARLAQDQESLVRSAMLRVAATQDEAKTWRAGLHPDDEATLHDWEHENGNFRTVVNRPDSPDAKRFGSLMDQAPSADDPVYRGTHESFGGWIDHDRSQANWKKKIGKHVELQRPVSASTDKARAGGFGNLVFEMQHKGHAKTIGNSLNEAVVMPSRHKVVAVRDEPAWENVATIDGRTRFTNRKTVVTLEHVGKARWRNREDQ